MAASHHVQTVIRTGRQSLCRLQQQRRLLAGTAGIDGAALARLHEAFSEAQSMVDSIGSSADAAYLECDPCARGPPAEFRARYGAWALEAVRDALQQYEQVKQGVEQLAAGATGVASLPAARTAAWSRGAPMTASGLELGWNHTPHEAVLALPWPAVGPRGGSQGGCGSSSSTAGARTLAGEEPTEGSGQTGPSQAAALASSAATLRVWAADLRAERDALLREQQAGEGTRRAPSLQQLEAVDRGERFHGSSRR